MTRVCCTFPLSSTHKFARPHHTTVFVLRRRAGTPSLFAVPLCHLYSLAIAVSPSFPPSAAPHHCPSSLHRRADDGGNANATTLTPPSLQRADALLARRAQRPSSPPLPQRTPSTLETLPSDYTTREVRFYEVGCHACHPLAPNSVAVSRILPTPPQIPRELHLPEHFLFLAKMAEQLDLALRCGPVSSLEPRAAAPLLLHAHLDLLPSSVTVRRGLPTFNKLKPVVERASKRCVF